MYKQVLIDAIQSENIVEVSFRKETTGAYVTRKVLPYDIFSQENKKAQSTDEVLLGYTEAGFDHSAHVIKIYLKDINNVTVLSEKFDGSSLQRLINPKDPPNISRNW